MVPHAQLVFSALESFYVRAAARIVFGQWPSVYDHFEVEAWVRFNDPVRLILGADSENRGSQNNRNAEQELKSIHDMASSKQERLRRNILARQIWRAFCWRNEWPRGAAGNKSNKRRPNRARGGVFG